MPISFIQIPSNLFPTVTPYNLQAIIPYNVRSLDNISIMVHVRGSEPIMFSHSLAAVVKMSLNNLRLLHWSSSETGSRELWFYWAAPSRRLVRRCSSQMCVTVQVWSGTLVKRANVICQSFEWEKKEENWVKGFSLRWEQLENSLLDINDSPPQHLPKSIIHSGSLSRSRKRG